MAAKQLFHTLSALVGSLCLAVATFATAAEPTSVATPPALQALSNTNVTSYSQIAPTATPAQVQDIGAQLQTLLGQPLPSRARAVLTTLGSYTRDAQEIIRSGFAYLGIDYRRGGTSPETGFDCSGLVRRVFDDAFGIDLPHNAKAMSDEGYKISVGDLRPGDLVFFNTFRKAFSHVGIYVGNNLFLHAPSSGGGVRLEDLRDNYWVKHFNGARRLVIE